MRSSSVIRSTMASHRKNIQQISSTVKTDDAFYARCSDGNQVCGCCVITFYLLASVLRCSFGWSLESVVPLLSHLVVDARLHGQHRLAEPVSQADHRPEHY